jgi:chaperone BCS1
MKKLNHFMENEKWHNKKGLPYNFGLLLHGEPGCGKTSCIKALANYTDRHIVEINLSKIKTCGQCFETFNNSMFNSKFIPQKKRIIVLEDLDCMIDIIKSRKSNVSNKNDTDTNANKQGEQFDDLMNYTIIKNLQEEKMSNDSNNKIHSDNKIDTNEDNDKEQHIKENENKKENKFNLMKKLFENDDELTLACILNTIDGVLENNGRMLIITTNYIDNIDSALIRSGRIDMKLNFTKCDMQMYYDILEFYYETKLRKIYNFTEYKYSPAEVFELCLLHNEEIQQTIDILMT